MWNFIIRFILESSLEMSFAVMVNILYLSWPSESIGVRISSFLTITNAVVLLAFTLFVAIFYIRKYKQFGTEEFDEKYGTVVEELDLKRGKKISLIYPVVFLMRRFIMSFMAVYLERWSYLQIMGLMYLSMAVIIILGLSEPFKTKKANRIEIFNEVSTMFVVYHLMIFTDFVPKVETKFLMGYSVIGVTSFNMLINMLMVLLDTMIT